MGRLLALPEARVEVTGPNLLQYGINYNHKKFYETKPQGPVL
jgi:hypothetical protein